VGFESAVLESGLDTVHRDQNASADAHHTDSFLRDAVVDGTHTHAQGLGSLNFRERYRANWFGLVFLGWTWNRTRRKDPLDFLPNGSLDCLEKGLREFVERKDLTMAIGLKNKFKSHDRAGKKFTGSGRNGEEKLARRISSE